MDYQFTAVPARTHLHTTGSGTHSPENLRRFLTDTHRVVLEQRWDAVLLEMQFSGPSLDLGNLYSIIVEKSTDAAILRRIAYVDRNTEHLPERAEFAELAANKLGVNARVFQTVVDAERWLQDGAAMVDVKARASSA
jgi:hypothetical protein